MISMTRWVFLLFAFIYIDLLNNMHILQTSIPGDRSKIEVHNTLRKKINANYSHSSLGYSISQCQIPTAREGSALSLS